MNIKSRALFVKGILDALYPNPEIPLKYKDGYSFLIAVLLSAQCTDVRVNIITPNLFHLADNPYDMVKHTVAEIEAVIHTCGLAPSKASYIYRLSQILIEKYSGEIPSTLEDLESLPGVGHKTASVIMVQYFNQPAFPVDTHIQRCAKRWGLSSGTSVRETEADLKKLFDADDWGRLHLQIIYFGREHCPARGHDQNNCTICSKLKK